MLRLPSRTRKAIVVNDELARSAARPHLGAERRGVDGESDAPHLATRPEPACRPVERAAAGVGAVRSVHVGHTLIGVVRRDITSISDVSTVRNPPNEQELRMTFTDRHSAASLPLATHSAVGHGTLPKI